MISWCCCIYLCVAFVDWAFDCFYDAQRDCTYSLIRCVAQRFGGQRLAGALAYTCVLHLMIAHIRCSDALLMH